MGMLYRLTSPSGKSYIGITSQTVAQRWWKHKNNASHDRALRMGSECLALYDAIRKYGSEGFQVETLAIADFDYLKDLEQKAIIAFKTKTPHGYNLTDGGDGALGANPTQESRQKMSAAGLKRLANPEELQRVRQAISKAGAVKVEKWWALSEDERIAKRKEHAAKLEAANRFTPEVRAKMSEAKKGLTYPKWSDERKAKTAETRKLEWADPVLRQKRLDGFQCARDLKGKKAND